MSGLPAAKRLFACDRTALWSRVSLIGILLFVAFIRFRLRDTPLERDEGEYAYGGQLLLHGIMPAKLLYTIKLPGTHAAYAVLMALFGQTCSGIHFGFLLVNLVTIWLVFTLGRRVAGNLAGVTAAATYALLSLSPDALGTSAHATHFVVVFALAGLCLLSFSIPNSSADLSSSSCSENHPPLIRLFLSGLLLGTSVLMKHNGIIFVGFALIWLLGLVLGRKLGPLRSIIESAALFIVGLVLPFAALVLVLACAHTLDRQWFWSVTYAGAYGKENPGLIIIWRSLTQRMPLTLQLPFNLSLLALVAIWFRRGSRVGAWFLAGLFLCSIAAVTPGFHFRPHYYVLLMPAVALLTGALVQQAADLFQRVPLRPLVAIPVLALLFAKEIYHDRQFFFELSPVDACRALYGYQPFPEARVLGEYLRSHSSPDARIVVLGSEPEIYFYSHRLSATGYIYTYPLTEHHRYAQQMRDELAREVAAMQPQFIVVVPTWTSWLARPSGRQRVLNIADTLIPPGYRAIGRCDFFPAESRVEWHWAADIPDSPNADLLVLERRADQISVSRGTGASATRLLPPGRFTQWTF